MKIIRAGDKLKPMPQLPIPLARIPALPGFCEPRGFANPMGITAGADGSSLPDDAQKSFSAGMSDDLLDQLVAQLQSQYDVRIDPAAVSQAQTR